MYKYIVLYSNDQKWSVIRKADNGLNYWTIEVWDLPDVHIAERIARILNSEGNWKLEEELAERDDQLLASNELIETLTRDKKALEIELNKQISSLKADVEDRTKAQRSQAEQIRGLNSKVASFQESFSSEKAKVYELQETLNKIDEIDPGVRHTAIGMLKGMGFKLIKEETTITTE